jgi:hypothetical protein
MLKKSYTLSKIEPIIEEENDFDDEKIEEENDFDDEGQSLHSQRSMLSRSKTAYRSKSKEFKIKVGKLKFDPFKFDKRNRDIFNSKKKDYQKQTKFGFFDPFNPHKDEKPRIKVVKVVSDASLSDIIKKIKEQDPEKYLNYDDKGNKIKTKIKEIKELE